MEGWCRHRNLLLPNILSNVIEGTEGKIWESSFLNKLEMKLFSKICRTFFPYGRMCKYVFITARRVILDLTTNPTAQLSLYRPKSRLPGQWITYQPYRILPWYKVKRPKLLLPYSYPLTSFCLRLLGGSSDWNTRQSLGRIWSTLAANSLYR